LSSQSALGQLREIEMIPTTCLPQTKKAPRRNEGLDVKAFEKLNEVIAYLIGAM
jgi:hypothetical protein